MGLQGVGVCLDEWAQSHEEIVEEHGKEIEKLAQLVAAAQLESVAKRLLEKGECTEQDVKRMAAEAELGKVMAQKQAMV